MFDNGPGGYGTDRIGDRYPEFSLAHNITKDDPPTLVLVGTRDNLIPAKLVDRFQANMKKVGVRCDVVYYDGQGHGFHGPKAAQGAWHACRTLCATDEFLASLGWLTGPTTLEKPENKPALSTPTKP